jgi:hypothetical protein
MKQMSGLTLRGKEGAGKVKSEGGVGVKIKPFNEIA